MRFEFESAITLLQSGETTKVPGLSLNGQDSTLNRHVTISGTTSDTNEFITYELIILEEEVFLKGLTGMPGIDPAQWYILPADIQAGVRRLPTARGLLASFNPTDVGNAQFERAGNETLDDQACSIWSAQHSPSAQNLLGVTADSQLKEQLGDIDSAEFSLWTCADGFIHLMTGQVQGHDPENEENKSTVTLRFRLSELDETLEIQAPTGARPFPSAPSGPTNVPPTASRNTPPPGPTGATPAVDATPAADQTPGADATPPAAETPGADATPASEATPTGSTDVPDATGEPSPSPAP
jgi:hypothetical protein